MKIYLSPTNFGSQTLIESFEESTSKVVKDELKAASVKVVQARNRLWVLEVEMPDFENPKDAVGVFRHNEKQWKHIHSWLKDRSLDLYDFDGDYQ